MATWEIDETRDDAWVIVDRTREHGFQEIAEVAFTGGDAEQIAKHIAASGALYTR